MVDTNTKEPPSAATPDGRGPLADLRILELANVIAGPTACQVLGDFGADIIKIEHPTGDGSRRQSPHKDGVSLWWKMIGRNKRSVGMYLGDPEVAEVFLELVKTCDVVVEGFRPGTMEKWNLGYDRLSAVNPRVILARLSGYGQTGPYARRPAFGSNLEAMSGLPSLMGDPDGPPTMPVYALGDFIAGNCFASAILMAIYERDRSGKGQVIDASLLLPLITAMARPVLSLDQLGWVEKRAGNRSAGGAPRNIYLARDGKWVAVSGATTEVAARIMHLVGRPEIAEEPWFGTGSGRVKHVDIIDEAVGSWIAQRTMAEAVAEAEAASCTFSPLYEVADMVADPHVVATNMITTVPDKDFGPMRMPNVLFRMSRTPGRIRFTGQDLGQSTESVLAEVGVGAERVSGLRARGVLA